MHHLHHPLVEQSSLWDPQGTWWLQTDWSESRHGILGPLSSGLPELWKSGIQTHILKIKVKHATSKKSFNWQNCLSDSYFVETSRNKVFKIINYLKSFWINTKYGFQNYILFKKCFFYSFILQFSCTMEWMFNDTPAWKTDRLLYKLKILYSDQNYVYYVFHVKVKKNQLSTKKKNMEFWNPDKWVAHLMNLVKSDWHFLITRADLDSSSWARENVTPSSMCPSTNRTAWIENSSTIVSVTSKVYQMLT